ncbi:hypothetical protein KHA94_16185 [Bacillus sp. FJAT-49705]|uniref:Uncharacterized protein n=1 Tax=Cytobacillus citreus TaxID=2833586 RepID=A0ABS5NWA9_9BACI|nr:hypothetical protein [Cytobacillus citreus]MBS4191729.1 hypothetical protein [Cytobacillus citreus]
MKVGDTKKWLYVPWIEFIDGEGSMYEIMKKVNAAEARNEVEDKKELRLLQRQYPGHEITKIGSSWMIVPNE